jgi:hypothetical protein
MKTRTALIATLCLLLLPAGSSAKPVWESLSYGKVPTSPVPGGEPNTFICRDLNGVPGRLQNGKCYATWGGKEYAVDHYEGLSMPPGTYHWTWYAGFLPEGAIVGGSQGTGKDVYICRTPGPGDTAKNSTGILSIGDLMKTGKYSRNGKFAPWTSTCYIGNKGLELRTNAFFVLVEGAETQSPPSISGAVHADQGESDTSDSPAPFLSGVTVVEAKPLDATAVVIPTGTTLATADATRIAALAQAGGGMPPPVSASSAGERVTGVRLGALEEDRLTVQIDYRYSPSRPGPVYAGAFVYDSAGVPLNVGYLPIAAPAKQGTIALTLTFPPSDFVATYLVVFLMESGQQPFLNGHFQFDYRWAGGRLSKAGATAAPQQGEGPSDMATLCTAYAARAVDLFRYAAQRQVPNIFPPVWSEDYAGHYHWCLGAAKQDVYAGHQLRVDYLRQMLPGEFSGAGMDLP